MRYYENSLQVLNPKVSTNILGMSITNGLNVVQNVVQNVTYIKKKTEK